MEQEKLIENVKAHEPLYVISHPKYSDNGFKENVWKGIAKEMNQPVAVCKKTWTNLRDSFRRALKKKRETKSGQAPSKIKKWRFEDEMSFLLPFMQERDTCNNLKDISDDNEGEPNEDEYDDKNDDRGDDQNDRRDDRSNNRGDNRNDNEDDDKDDDVNEELHIEDEKKKKEKEVNRKIINVARNKRKRCQTQPETASAIMMKYLLDKKTAKEQITPSSQQPNAIDTFFASIASTVKNFSPYYQNIAKSQIFSIISDLEMKQIMQEQSFFVLNIPTQRQHSAQMQPYHTGPYNVSRSLPSPSPSPSSTIHTISPSSSRIATPIQSPSCYDFPAIPMPHLNEETVYTENMNM